MKKTICLMLVMLVLFSCPFAMAEETSKVVFSVSEADDKGIVELKITLFNYEYNGFQANLRYNPEVLRPLNYETLLLVKEVEELVGRQDKYKDAVTELATKLDEENGIIGLAHYVNINGAAEEIVRNNLIVAPESGLEIYSIRFERLKDKKIEFLIATDEKSLPKGIIVAGNKMSYGVEAEFVYPDRVEKSIKTYDKAIEENPEIQQDIYAKKREERKKGTYVFQIGNYAAVVEGSLCIIDEENKAVVPILKDGRTMIPIRFLAQKMGATVLWDEGEQKVTISKDECNLVMKIGCKEYEKNGVNSTMDVCPELYEERTYVPLRFVTEGLGENATWLENTSAIVVSPKENPWDTASAVEQQFLNDALLIMSPLIRDMN